MRKEEAALLIVFGAIGVLMGFGIGGTVQNASLGMGIGLIAAFVILVLIGIVQQS